MCHLLKAISGLEIELKLLLAAADLRRIGRCGAVTDARRNSGTVRKLHTVYFDTPDQLLRRNQVALRLRRSGRSWIQTVKGGGTEIGGLHSREEIEWTVLGGAIDLDLLATSPFAKLFARSRVRRDLAPAFETAFQRRTIDLQLANGALAQLCLDQGEILAGAAREAICEAEIELLSGDPMALLDFADQLLNEIPFRIGPQSKAERGYALAALNAGTAAGPMRAGRVAISAADDPQAVFARIVASTASQVHANESGLLDGKNPEYLHQMRVGLRRLRTALAMPRGESWESASRPLRHRLRQLSRSLGEARNWDVFVHEIMRPMIAHCGSRQLAGLRIRAWRRRAAALATAREAVRTREYTRLWLELARLMSSNAAGIRDTTSSSTVMAQAMLGRRFRGLSEGLAGEADEGKLHRLRIAAKKLRYVSEFFSALYPGKKLRRFLAPLAELQEVLGNINDATIAQALVAGANQGASPLDAQARGFALGWIAAEQAQAMRGIKRAMKAPLKAGIFWE